MLGTEGFFGIDDVQNKGFNPGERVRSRGGGQIWKRECAQLPHSSPCCDTFFMQGLEAPVKEKVGCNARWQSGLHSPAMFLLFTSFVFKSRQSFYVGCARELLSLKPLLKS